jgi:hypothetical protein
LQLTSIYHIIYRRSNIVNMCDVTECEKGADFSQRVKESFFPRNVVSLLTESMWNFEVSSCEFLVTVKSIGRIYGLLFYPQKKEATTHWIGFCVGLTFGLAALKKRENFLVLPEKLQWFFRLSNSLPGHRTDHNTATLRRNHLRRYYQS